MRQLNIYEAKTHFSQLVEDASNGETFLIAKSGIPLAKLTPIEKGMDRKSMFGALKGKIEVAPDFDAPLPDEVIALFEGGVKE